jgi:DNA/RNA endonuclease YhcR with UshA esterase domain
MRRRKAHTILIAIITIASLSVTLIYVHDNPSGLTPIGDINSGDIPAGTVVVVKGEVKWILQSFSGFDTQQVCLSDGTGELTFYWSRFQFDESWHIIIVRGKVLSNERLHVVTSVELVVLFP